MKTMTIHIKFVYDKQSSSLCHDRQSRLASSRYFEQKRSELTTLLEILFFWGALDEAHDGGTLD